MLEQLRAFRPRRDVVQRATCVLVMVMLIAACSSGAADEASTDVDGVLVEYTRVWPDGLTEREVVASDGGIMMWHGDHLERFTLPAGDIDLIREALAAEIPVGSPDDSPARTLILEDGSVIAAPRPEPGSVTELLERLMETHSLG